jgi:hypothetical protein
MARSTVTSLARGFVGAGIVGKGVQRDKLGENQSEIGSGARASAGAGAGVWKGCC